jgi:DNA-directed RNA polymerase subunit N (RpoN/RPB10)
MSSFPVRGYSTNNDIGKYYLLIAALKKSGKYSAEKISKFMLELGIVEYADRMHFTSHMDRNEILYNESYLKHDLAKHKDLL